VAPPVTAPPIAASPPASSTLTLPAATTLDLEVEVPSWTPSGSIYLAVSLPLGGQSWSPQGVTLSPNAQGRYTGSLVVAPGASFQAKVTRGSWATVEKGPALEELDNRTITAGSGPTHVFLHVFHWGDDQIPGATGTVNDLGVFAPTKLLPRTVVSHLPPGYFDPANANVRYPVLYALDGQNLFDPSLSFSGVAWGLDTASDGNALRGRGAFICIGIYNTQDRIAEYTPSFDPAQNAGGKLEDLASWIFSELKPTIDALYRTSPAAKDTGLMGSSLGGLAALNVGFKHPDKVQRIAALSPSLWWNNQDTLALVQGTTVKPPLQIWLDVGTNEDGSSSQQVVDNARAMLSALENLGFVQTADLAYEEAAGAQHTESAWAARLPDVLSFLFP
jgi:predicted alpha/beta superfamily hydrolase